MGGDLLQHLLLVGLTADLITNNLVENLLRVGQGTVGDVAIKTVAIADVVWRNHHQIAFALSEIAA